MLTDEQYEAMRKRRMVYLLDTFDATIDELIDAFAEVGQPLLSSLFAGMRLHMYLHGEKLGINNQERTVSLDNIRNKMLEQQRICTQILTKHQGEADGKDD